MSLIEKNYGFAVGEHWVEVVGKTKAVSPLWSLLVDGNSVDNQVAMGEFTLSALVDDKSLEATINQGGFGDVKISVNLDGKIIQRFSGFLL